MRDLRLETAEIGLSCRVVAAFHSPTALETIARLRTMRALLTGMDRARFEQLVAGLEQAVWEMEDITADLARSVATGIGEALPTPGEPLDLTGIMAAALRNVEDALASRAVTVSVDAAPAIFTIGNRDRLEHLFTVALAIAASAVPPGGRIRLACRTSSERVDVSIEPYRARDPRTIIVAALAQSQGADVHGTDSAMTLQLLAAAATPA
jgi:hypothetical protein